MKLDQRMSPPPDYNREMEMLQRQLSAAQLNEFMMNGGFQNVKHTMPAPPQLVAAQLSHPHLAAMNTQASPVDGERRLKMEYEDAKFKARLKAHEMAVNTVAILLGLGLATIVLGAIYEKVGPSMFWPGLLGVTTALAVPTAAFFGVRAIARWWLERKLKDKFAEKFMVS